MHAQYVRIWFVAGLALCAAAVLAAFSSFAAHAPTLLVVGLANLALALALGLLPAFARRDWPSPVYAWAGVLLAALGVAAVAAPRVSSALLGAALLVGGAQPLALLLSPRWKSPRASDAHAATDRVVLGGIGLSLAGALASGLLLIALPRGLPYAAHAVALLGCVFPAGFATLLFVLPRHATAPLRSATLGFAALAAFALGAFALGLSLALPFAANFPAGVALVALAYALAATTLMRAPRPPGSRPLLAGTFALAILAALALALATAGGAPNPLLPVALFAHVALGAALLAAAFHEAAPLLLPGRAREGWWVKAAPALLIAALFLYTPALQYGRSETPAALAGALGLALLVRGLAPMARGGRS